MGLLLDTCAVIWLANNDPVSPAARSRVIDAGLRDETGHIEVIPC